MRHTFLLPVLLGTLFPLVVGCGGPTLTVRECEALESAASETELAAMQGFASESELSSYLAKTEAKAAEREQKLAECRGPRGSSIDSSGADAPMAAGSPGASGPTPNEGITNNQEGGADEGGIVKNIGSSLVVLRMGRLFAVDVAATPTLTDSLRVAPTDRLNKGVWYDEMLVKGDMVYVVGYRYSLPDLAAGSSAKAASGATEIDSFRLAGGKLTRVKSMFLESNDYFSGKNYASRMVDGNLVFYMPHHVGRKDAALSFPRVLELDQTGALRPVGPIFGALDVTRSHERPFAPTFHTVVKCSLPATGDLDCHGKSVLGSWWREHYVSGRALYLWSQSHAYRFDLATLDVTVHAARGAPRDQFSFKETDDALVVAVQGSGGLALTKLPLAAFDKRGAQAVTLVPLGLTRVRENRFVGSKLVAAGDSSTGAGQQKLVTVDVKTLDVAQIAGPDVVRIEPLDGDRALVVSTRPAGKGLVLGAYSTDALTAPPAELALDGLSEGESRSHGFFFKPSPSGGGTFGYAVVNGSSSRGGSSGFGDGISNLGFFTVAAERGLSKVGVVSSGNVVGECETSCTDWYGNTRPIFLGERVFALMGSELVEVSLASNASRVGQAAILKTEPSDSPSP